MTCMIKYQSQKFYSKSRAKLTFVRFISATEEWLKNYCGIPVWLFIYFCFWKDLKIITIHNLTVQCGKMTIAPSAITFQAIRCMLNMFLLILDWIAYWINVKFGRRASVCVPFEGSRTRARFYSLVSYLWTLYSVRCIPLHEIVLFIYFFRLLLFLFLLDHDFHLLLFFLWNNHIRTFEIGYITWMLVGRFKTIPSVDAFFRELICITK